MRVLRDRPDELLFKLSLSPWSREEYQQSRVVCKNTADYDELEVARAFYVNCWQAIGGETSGWRKCKDIEQRGGRKLGFQYALEALGDLYVVAERLMGVQIENQDAIKLAAAHNNPTTLIYADPPYVSETRTGHTGYRCEDDAPEFHAALAEVLRAHGGAVVLSGYNCPLYEDLYSGWERHDREASVNIGYRVESVWLNQQAVEALGRPTQLTMFS
jgi:DNA adenine methylase